MQQDILPKEYEEYFLSRLEDLSLFDKSVNKCLSSMKPSPPEDIYPRAYENKPYSKRKLGRLTKSLTKLVGLGLAFKTTRKTGEGYNLYFSTKILIETLFEKGPSTKDEIIADLDLPKMVGKPKFLEVLLNQELISQLGSKTIYYYLTLIPEYKEQAEFREIPYSEEVYTILADGRPRKSGEIFKALSKIAPSIERKALSYYLRTIRRRRDWLVGMKVRGGQEKTYYRKDKASDEIVESLKTMKDEYILRKILMILKEPKTGNQIEEESKLSRKIVSVSLEKLMEKNSIFEVKASDKKYSTSNPAVYFRRDHNSKNKLNELKALFISESLKHGEKMFECFLQFPILNRKKIVETTGIGYYVVSGLLTRYKRLGLIQGHPELPFWYSPKIYSEKELKKILQLYNTVLNGIEGFSIGEKYGIFVAIPEKKLSPEELGGVANLMYIPVDNGRKLHVPKTEDKADFFSTYRRYSKLIKSLIS